MSVFVINSPAGLITTTDAKAWQPVFAVDVGAQLMALLKAAQAAMGQLNSWIGRDFCEQMLAADACEVLGMGTSSGLRQRNSISLPG